MIRIECINCRTVKEVEVGRGRARYTCGDKCRMAAYRKQMNDPEKWKEVYEERKRVIDRQYKEARRSSMSPASLRNRAIRVLNANGWSAINIGVVFKLSDERIHQIIGGVKNGRVT